MDAGLEGWWLTLCIFIYLSLRVSDVHEGLWMVMN